MLPQIIHDGSWEIVADVEQGFQVEGLFGTINKKARPKATLGRAKRIPQCPSVRMDKMKKVSIHCLFKSSEDTENGEMVEI